MEESRVSCENCQLVSIQGVICHESGCITSWIDPLTGSGYVRECEWCGSDFVPEEKNQEFCDKSCAEIYFR